MGPRGIARTWASVSRTSSFSLLRNSLVRRQWGSSLSKRGFERGKVSGESPLILQGFAPLTGTAAATRLSGKSGILQTCARSCQTLTPSAASTSSLSITPRSQGRRACVRAFPDRQMGTMLILNLWRHRRLRDSSGVVEAPRTSRPCVNYLFVRKSRRLDRLSGVQRWSRRLEGYLESGADPFRLALPACAHLSIDSSSTSHDPSTRTSATTTRRVSCDAPLDSRFGLD